MAKKSSYSLQIFAQGEEQPYSLQLFTCLNDDVAKRLARQVVTAHGEMADHASLYALNRMHGPIEEGEIILQL